MLLPDAATPIAFADDVRLVLGAIVRLHDCAASALCVSDRLPNPRVVLVSANLAGETEVFGVQCRGVDCSAGAANPIRRHEVHRAPFVVGLCIPYLTSILADFGKRWNVVNHSDGGFGFLNPPTPKAGPTVVDVVEARPTIPAWVEGGALSRSVAADLTLYLTVSTKSMAGASTDG